MKTSLRVPQTLLNRQSLPRIEGTNTSEGAGDTLSDIERRRFSWHQMNFSKKVRVGDQMLHGGDRKVSCRQGNRPGYIPPEQVGWAGLHVHFQRNKSYHRAAAHDQLDDLESVIADCNVAVKLNNKYVKALDRRAKTVRKQAMQVVAIYNGQPFY